MKVLLTAPGFIGARLAHRLSAVGHQVIDGRSVIDLSRPQDKAEWRAQLQGVEVLANTAGVFRDQPVGALEAVHHLGPAVLFDAAAEAGVQRIVQLSALGAAPDAPQAFLASKGRGDADLAHFDGDWHILRPSLVFGVEGASSKLLLALAQWPMFVLPEGGLPVVQPVHVDDVVDGLQRMVEGHAKSGEVIAAVGPEPLTLADYLQALRSSQRLPRAKVVAVPQRVAMAASRLAQFWPSSIVTPDALEMLMAGSQADPQPFTQLLGRPPRAVHQFMNEV